MGQPWGLANLFGIELWERFSFYGMQALLGYYLYYAATDGGLGVNEGTAVAIVGAYGGFVYMMALVASFVSDRILGPERTLFYSAILVMIGHICLAFLPGFAGLALGLVGVGVGSGGVKTAAQVVLGDLYTLEDPKRDSGFSIFYMAVNIGALLGPMLTGHVRELHGFHWGFGLAAIGMALGLGQYIAMRKTTIGAAGSTIPSPLPRNEYGKWLIIVLAIIAVAVALLTTGILPMDKLPWAMFTIALVAAAVMIYQMCTSEATTEVERHRVIGFIPLMVGCVIFFSIFQSQFTVLALYSDKRVNRDINLGFIHYVMSPEQVQSFNPFFIVVLSGVFAWMWTKLGTRQWSSPVKFSVAMVIIGASLFLFLPYAGGGENSTPLTMMVVLLFFFTVGELLLSPIGNSLATKVAPQAFKSRMFAVWLMAVSMGTSLSGVLGDIYESAMNTGADAERTFFLTAGIGAMLLGAVIFFTRGWVLKKFEGVR